MGSTISAEVIQSFRQALDEHPVYAAIGSVEDLQCFMEHHVYSVWDFMSLIKYLQSVVAPTRYPWLPGRDTAVRRFINELVLEEESDQGLPDADGAETFTSHFDLYCGAMQEIGARNATVLAFVERVGREGIEAGLTREPIPEPARRFTRTTFDFIGSGKPHVVAAALALGREHIIPGMFRAFLGRIGVTERQAPTFHYYLKRHIHLDEDFHAPLSLRLLNELCAGDAVKVEEAVTAARQAIAARIAFWDGVGEAILARRPAGRSAAAV